MKRKTIALLLSLFLLFLLVIVSVCIGSFPLSPGQILDFLLGKNGGTLESKVFWQLRVPRVIMGIVSGGALALSGCIYQTIFQNPLASPDLTGVASGASFGAACAIVFGSGSIAEMITGSFLASLLALGLVLLLVRFSRSGQLGVYILSGIIISSLADAGLMILKTLADPERELATIEFWTMGSLANITLQKLLPLLPVILLPLVFLLLFYKQAVILSLGAQHARSIGLDPELWRPVLLVLSTLMVAGVVSVTGVIAFVGLIAPHIAALSVREKGGTYFIQSVITGMDLLLLADIFARSLSPGAELPLSILTVFLAVPVLVLLLCRRKDGTIL